MIKLKSILTLVLIVFFAPTSVFAWSWEKVCFDNKECVRVEVAQTRAEVRRGLMFRQYMPERHGMLFVFPHMGKHAFWMKNTIIPLDIIWMDDNGVVVWVEPKAKPCVVDPCLLYRPMADAKYVLEVNAGMATVLGVKRGSRMRAFGQSHSSLYY
ncbi:MAG: DUF192 domain-containing protein [bacterium]|nr:DUF192 domain-containing protein [bacterium]